jgi:hypothetical protein
MAASRALTQVRWVMSRFAAVGLVGPGGGQTWVVLTNRQVLVEPINERLALPIT